METVLVTLGGKDAWIFCFLVATEDKDEEAAECEECWATERGDAGLETGLFVVVALVEALSNKEKKKEKTSLLSDTEPYEMR